MFKIGFEFEVITELEKNEVRALLRKEFPEWHKEIKIVRDYTFSGWELVTPPYAEIIADTRLSQIFSFIKNNKDFSTDKTTAFHVNISFEDITLNESIQMDTLYANTDIDGVLKKFGRLKNTYCRSPKNYLFYNYIDVNNLHELTKFLNDSQYRNKRMETMRTAFNQELKENRKNIPIADKRYKKLRYFEFRMIGGENYHTRKTTITRCIEQFKQALLKSTKGQENG